MSLPVRVRPGHLVLHAGAGRGKLHVRSMRPRSVCKPSGLRIRNYTPSQHVNYVLLFVVLCLLNAACGFYLRESRLRRR